MIFAKSVRIYATHTTRRLPTKIDSLKTPKMNKKPPSASPADVDVYVLGE